MLSGKHRSGAGTAVTYVRRAIDLTFRLGKGTFGQTSYEQVTVSGLRVQVSIQNAGGPSMGQATVRVHGLTLSMMNELAQVMRLASGAIVIRFNQITISAGDYGTKLPQIFQGNISLAPIQMGGAPDAVLELAAYAGAFEQAQMIPATSYPGPVDAAQVLSTMAAQAVPPYAFENNGASCILDAPYFWGSLREQMYSCVRQAKFEWNALDNGVLAIWPKGGSRFIETPLPASDVITVTAPASIPIISPDTGMAGYPTNWNLGVAVTTVFNPNLRIGKRCQVQSQLPFANGIYTMWDISHEIESEMPNGQWTTSFHGVPANSDLYPAPLEP
jgi:hypothetical protein